MNTVNQQTPIIDGIDYDLKGVDIGGLNNIAEAIAQKPKYQYIVRTVRGIEDCIVSFTAFRIGSLIPDHRKTEQLNTLLKQAHSNATKSCISQHFLMQALSNCKVDPETPL